MNTKYTEGPWYVLEQGGEFRITNGLCMVNLRDEANARLIACAPELLEMLDKIIEDCYNNNFVSSVSLLREADRLIAKATAKGE